jgi:hypothetical protein
MNFMTRKFLKPNHKVIPVCEEILGTTHELIKNMHKSLVLLNNRKDKRSSREYRIFLKFIIE